MKKKVSSAITLFIALLIISLCTSKNAHSMTKYLDGKLLVSGFLKETAFIRTDLYDRSKDYRDSALDFLNTTFFMEGLYKIKENPGDGFNINLYAGLKWWWEKAPALDDNLNRHIAHRDGKDYKHPRNFDEDMLTEIYLHIKNGPLQVKIGKQIVIWGQLNTTRTADVVNPLDFRWGPPGIQTWEELKKGLWMIRALYQSELPGDLRFEVIFNPGYFQPIRLSYTGTHWGGESFRASGFGEGKQMGMFSWLREKMVRDAPTWDMSENYEFGGRIGGYTWGIDWTLLYWNALSDGPVIDPDKATPFAFQYVWAGLKAMMSNANVNPGDWPSYRVFYYKRYQTLGGTAQVYFPNFYNSMFDFEWAYEIGSPLNKGEGGSSQEVYDWTRRDVLGLAVKYSNSFHLPRSLQKMLLTNKMIDYNITYSWAKVFSHEHYLTLDSRNHRPGDSTMDTITLFWKVEMFNTSWVLVFIGDYWPRIGHWMAVPSFTYIFREPLTGLRAEVGYKAYGRKRDKLISSDYDKKDSIILRLRYEF